MYKGIFKNNLHWKNYGFFLRDQTREGNLGEGQREHRVNEFGRRIRTHCETCIENNEMIYSQGQGDLRLGTGGLS